MHSFDIFQAAAASENSNWNFEFFPICPGNRRRGFESSSASVFSYEPIPKGSVVVCVTVSKIQQRRRRWITTVIIISITRHASFVRSPPTAAVATILLVLRTNDGMRDCGHVYPWVHTQSPVIADHVVWKVFTSDRAPP